ncbi:MAG: homoserine dehydrogenase, partial [Oscillospiraceae bacterium]|nr:homoserine dehydrogenase [Oscillospiraceae bacterium]
VADILNALKPGGAAKNLSWEDSGDNSFVADYKQQKHRFYLRLADADKTLAEKVFGDVVFLSRKDAPGGEIAFITAEITGTELEEKCKELQVLGRIRIFDM